MWLVVYAYICAMQKEPYKKINDLYFIRSSFSLSSSSFFIFIFCHPGNEKRDYHCVHVCKISRNAQECCRYFHRIRLRQLLSFPIVYPPDSRSQSTCRPKPFGSSSYFFLYSSYRFSIFFLFFTFFRFSYISRSSKMSLRVL